MARRRHNNRKRRRGRLSFLYKLLTFVGICAVIVGAVTFFFRLEEVEVTGSTHYTQEEIVTASGLEPGDNLYLMNKYAVAERIRRLPYVETVQIRRRLPATITVRVTETNHVAGIVQGGDLWLVSPNLRLLEKLPASLCDSYCLIRGVTLTEPAVGAAARIPEEGRAAPLQQLLTALSSKDMTDETNVIDLTDETAVTLEYAQRFRVLVPARTDFAYKMEYLKAVVGKLENNEKGTIDLQTDGKASFIPD